MNTNTRKRRASDADLDSSVRAKNPRVLDISVSPRRQHQFLRSDLAARWRALGHSVWELASYGGHLLVETAAIVVTLKESSPSGIPRTPDPLLLRLPPPQQQQSPESTSDVTASVPPSTAPSFSFSSTPSLSGVSNRSSLIGPPGSSSLTSLSHRSTPFAASRGYLPKPHILDRQHKASLENLRKEELDELRALFSQEKKRGFQSDFNSYKAYIQYAFRLERLEKEGNKPSFASELGLSASMPSRKRHSMNDDSRSLRSAISTAKRRLSRRRPKAWIPTLTQMDVMNRTKDEAIENRLRPKRPPLPASLPSQDEAEVDEILSRKGDVSQCGREPASARDLARLRPGQWLNDAIINCYGALIQLRSEAAKENSTPLTGEHPLNVHYFSTFFWPKLVNQGYVKGRMAKWTKKIDIFSKDIILFAINHGDVHWTSAAINFRRKRIESYDSMGSGKSEVYKHLRQYLDLESKDKKKCPFDFTGWVDWDLEDMPQQENGVDCGVFTCQVLQALSLGDESFNFTQKDMKYMRRRMIWEIGNAKLRDNP